MTQQFSLKYIGLDQEKNQFSYIATVNGHKFPYFTGLGWITQEREGTKPLSSEEMTFLEWNTDRHTSNKIRSATFSRPYRRKEPTEMDVLSCLYVDSQCGQQSFKEFCDNCGYSDDSLKALDVYRQCMETTNKMRGFKWPEKIEEY